MAGARARRVLTAGAVWLGAAALALSWRPSHHPDPTGLLSLDATVVQHVRLAVLAAPAVGAVLLGLWLLARLALELWTFRTVPEEEAQLQQEVAEETRRVARQLHQHLQRCAALLTGADRQRAVDEMELIEQEHPELRGGAKQQQQQQQQPGGGAAAVAGQAPAPRERQLNGARHDGGGALKVAEGQEQQQQAVRRSGRLARQRPAAQADASGAGPPSL